VLREVIILYKEQLASFSRLTLLKRSLQKRAFMICECWCNRAEPRAYRSIKLGHTVTVVISSVAIADGRQERGKKARGRFKVVRG
jgi:hypothetical protein